MVDNRAIPSNALVPVGAGVSDAGGVVEIVLLELFAAAQVLKEAFRAVDFPLDERPHGGVGTPVQILVDTIHAAGKSTGTGKGRGGDGRDLVVD